MFSRDGVDYVHTVFCVVVVCLQVVGRSPFKTAAVRKMTGSKKIHAYAVILVIY